ncbi:hypothetical protein [Kumtagia ephedrae]|uniref:hypothetical protein n=1 Tax=Kumtagia ephedrae TaxID=2116701 RepID=UPI001401D7E4|nr:hypothetical protein [Mesorhizobium ephedrae]
MTGNLRSSPFDALNEHPYRNLAVVSAILWLIIPKTENFNKSRNYLRIRQELQGLRLRIALLRLPPPIGLVRAAWPA